MDYNHRTAAELWQRFTERHQAEMTPAILKAGEFALEAHRGQNRKIDCLPYVSHVFDVAEILLGCKASENLVIAGILHDILEDTSQTADDIRALFPAEHGEAILHIIMADNESDKEAPWQERKMETIRYAETTEETDGLLLICADKIQWSAVWKAAATWSGIIFTARKTAKFGIMKHCTIFFAKNSRLTTVCSSVTLTF